MWYPENKKDLEKFIKESIEIESKLEIKKINGLIVPHAGYEYSGKIAAKAYSLLREKNFSKAIILGPSHYISTNKILTSNKKEIVTPLGKIKTFNLGFEESDISQEHSINNQIPFLQYLGIKEILPLMIGDITEELVKETAKKLSNIKDCIFIFSTDLSHFLDYEEANYIDIESISLIETLRNDLKEYIDACGYNPLNILFELCKIKKTRPHLIEYKNSGDITGDKSSVVGYASFYF